MADESIIRIRADASQAVSELTKLRNAITLSYNSLDKAAESFKELKDRQKALKDITKISTKFIDKLGKTLHRTGANSKQAKAEFAKLNLALKTTSQNFSSASMRARAFSRDMKGVGLAIRNSGKNLQFMGRSIMIGMLPFANAIRKASNFARALEQAEIRFIKITGLIRGSTEFKDLANDMERISKQFGVSRDMITDIATDFALVGMPLGEIDKLVQASNELAILGQIDVGPAKDIVTSTVFAMRNMAQLSGDTISFSEAIKQASTQLYYFNLVNNNTAMAIKDMAVGLPKLIPITVQFGLTVTEAAGALAALKASGVSAAEGTVALRTGILRLTSLTKQAQEAVDEATESIEGFNFRAGVGIETLASFADSLFLVQKAAGDRKAFELVKKIMGIRQTAKFKLFTSDLMLASSEVENTADQIRKLGEESGIDDVFGGKSIKTLVDFARASREPTKEMKEFASAFLTATSPDGTKMLETVTSQFLRTLIIQMGGAQNAMDTASAEMLQVFESDAFKMQQARIDIKNATTEIGGLINMMIVDHILPHIRKLVEMFRGIPDPIKKVIVVVAALVASFGPLLYMLAIMKMAFGQTLQIVAGAIMKMVSRMTAAGRAAIISANQEAAAVEFITAAKSHEIAMTDLLIAKEWQLAAARKGSTDAAVVSTVINKQITSTNAAMTAAAARAGGGGGARAGFMAALTGRASKNAAGTFVDQTGTGTSSHQFMKGSAMANLGANLRGQTFMGKSPVQATQARWAKMMKSGKTRGRKMGRWMDAGPSARQSGLSWLRGKSTPGVLGVPGAPITGPHVGGAASLFAPTTVGGVAPMASARSQFVSKVATKAKSGGRAAMAATMAPVQSMKSVAKAAGGAGKAVVGKVGGAFKAIMPIIKGIGGAFMKILPHIMTMAKFLLQPINLLRKLLFFARKLNPWGLAITVLFGLFAAVFVTIKNNFQTFIRAAQPGLDALKSAWDNIKGALGSVMDAIFQIFNRLSFGAKKGADEGTQMGKIFGAVFQAIAVAVNVVATLIKGLAYVISTAMSFISPALNILLGGLTVIINIIKAIVALVKGDFSGAWGYAKRAIGAVLLTIVGFIEQVFSFFLNRIADMVGALGSVLGGLGSVLPDWMGGSALKAAADGINVAEEAVRNFGQTLLDPVMQGIEKGLGIGADDMIKIGDEDMRNIGSEAGKIFGTAAAEEIPELVGEGDEPGWHNAVNMYKEMGEEAGKAWVDGYVSAYGKFIKLVYKLLSQTLKEIVQERMDIFDAATKEVVDGFQAEIATIQAVIKEEARLSKEVAYQTKRREQIKDMALRRDSYRRNRALAIYEGRIDDARSLDLKEKADKEKADAKLADLDADRGRVVLAQERADAMDAINEQRTAYEEGRANLRDTLADMLADVTEFVPENKEQWDLMLANIAETVEGVTGEEGVLADLKRDYNPDTIMKTAMDKAVEIMQAEYVWQPAIGPLDWMADYFADFELKFTTYEQQIKDFKDRLAGHWEEENITEDALDWGRQLMATKGMTTDTFGGGFVSNMLPRVNVDDTQLVSGTGLIGTGPEKERVENLPYSDAALERIDLAWQQARAALSVVEVINNIIETGTAADISTGPLGAALPGLQAAADVINLDPGAFVPDVTEIVQAPLSSADWDALIGGDWSVLDNRDRIVHEGVAYDSSGRTAMQIAQDTLLDDHGMLKDEQGGTGFGGLESIDPQNILPDLVGVKASLVSGVLTMANEAAKKGLGMYVSGGMRPMSEQIRLFKKYYNETDQASAEVFGAYGDRFYNGKWWAHDYGPEVAVPGSSMHGRGEAIDISGPDRQKADRWKFMNQWGHKSGVWTPLDHEPWHWTRYPKTNIHSLFTGGMVGGAGSAAQMIMAHGQEYVMSAAATRRIGVGNLNNMNNYARFTGPTGAAGGTTNTSSSNVTIHVDTFVGQREWFEKMMSDYNIHVAPSSERARGIEKRTVGSYTERNTRSRV